MTRWITDSERPPEGSRIPHGILAFVRAGWSPGYPSFIRRARGGWAWDTADRRYVDWVSGKGAVTLGHGRAEVDRAAAERAANGVLLPGCAEEYSALADALAASIALAEKSVFVKNGSDAVAVALRLARCFTSRDVIATSGYHGWDERFTLARKAGERRELAPNAVVDFGYDAELLEALLSEHGSRVAAVLVTPEPGFLGAEFLARVLELAHSASALAIFDEVRAGMRIRVGGAHELFGLRPDLITLSKGLANGYPLAAVTGRADVLDASEKTFIFGTYYAEAQALAAAVAVNAIYRAEDPIAKMAATGEALAREIELAFAEAGVRARAVGPEAQPQILFEEPRAEALFYGEMARAGVLMFQEDGQCPNTAHDADALALTREALGPAARRVRDEVQAGRAEPARPSDAAVQRYASARGISVRSEPRWLGG